MNAKSLIIAKIICTFLLFGVWGLYVGYFITENIRFANWSLNLTLYSIIPILVMYKPLLWVGGYRVKPKILYSIWIVAFLLSFALVNTVKDVWGGGIIFIYPLVVLTPWIFPRELKHIFENDHKKDSVTNIFWFVVGYFVLRFALEPVEKVFELSSIVPVFVGFGIGISIRFWYLRLRRSQD